jgi:PAS domain S-box-containing protein
VSAEPSFGLQEALAELGVDLAAALERIDVPAWLVGPDGRIVWANEAVRRLLGDVVGRPAVTMLAPESRRAGEEAIVAKAIGRERTTYGASVLDTDGRRIPVEISSVALRNGGEFAGIFGLATPPGQLEPMPPPAREPRLTPRQFEVLRLLGHGASTAQIAAALRVEEETVRNHVRALLKRLGQRSRVAAVAYARRHGLL